MRTILLIFHLIFTLAMIILILFQRSEGGIGLGGASPTNLMLVRGTANMLTRATAILAALFMGTNLLLVIVARYENAKVIMSLKQEMTEPPPISSSSVQKDVQPSRTGQDSAPLPSKILKKSPLP